MMNSFRTLVLQLRIFTPCATERHVGTPSSPETRRLETGVTARRRRNPSWQSAGDSGVGRDAPHDRCGQDEQHCIDHNPVRNHVATSFNS